VRPLALNVALGLIACPLMKVHGGVGSTPRWRVRSWSV
jgi:hypothetical protein